MGKNCVNPGNPEYARSENYNKRRNKGLSKSAACGNRTIHKGAHTISKCHDVDTADSESFNRLVLGKQRQHRIPEKVKQKPQDKCAQK